MAEQEVDALLARMAQIASAVNAFKSETVQQAVLAALIAAFETGMSHKPHVASPKARDKVQPETDQRTDGDDESSNTGGSTSKSKRKSKAGGSANGAAVQPVRDLDLRPKGQESFDEFVAKKQPMDNQERFAVAVYYLEEISKISPITLGHLAAVFKQTAGWREPNNLRAGVQMTGYRKNTIDTSDFSHLRTTPHGRNFVEHDLPRTSSKKGK